MSIKKFLVLEEMVSLNILNGGHGFMKKITFFMLVLFTLMGSSFADDQKAKETILKRLDIDFDSITLVSAQELSPLYYDAVLSFRILPTNSCQENYEGVIEDDSDTYRSVYSSKYNARCKAFARSRIVEQHFLITLYDVSESTPENTSITLNGEELVFVKSNNQLVLDR